MRFVENAVYFDHRAFSWCQQRRHRDLLVVISRLVSHSADGYWYVLLGLVAWQQGYNQFVALGVLAYIAERTCYFVIKKSVKRNRPPDTLPNFQSIIQAHDKFSFPSGHTSAAFLMATLLALYLPWTAWIMYPWACCVGWSRVMLGVHFPGDTLAGAAMGSTLTITTAFALGVL